MNKLPICQQREITAICSAFPASHSRHPIPFRPADIENVPPAGSFSRLVKSMHRILLAFALMAFLPAVAPAQCFVLQYANSRRVLKVDGDFVLDYNSLKRIYKFDGDYLLSYATYKRLLKFDGRFIVRYSDNRRIAYLDGEYLIRYSDYRRIAKLECPGRRSALAAAAYFLL